MNTSLPFDSEVRKTYPLFSGCKAYFPAALAGVAHHSFISNEKHNKGQPLHHSRGKSNDHQDCIERHNSDLGDLMAALKRGEAVNIKDILYEANAMAWRALALSQELHEEHAGCPLAPAARLAVSVPPPPLDNIPDFLRPNKQV